METVMYYYILFAITTSIASVYELIHPVLSQLKEIDPTNNVVEYKYLTYTTFFLIGIIAAPFMLPATIVPSFGERFRNSLMQSLNQD